MERCKTCKHWDRATVQSFPGWPDNGQNSGGYCRSDLMTEEGGYAPNALVYSYCEGGRFWTGPEFGCVNHELAFDKLVRADYG